MPGPRGNPQPIEHAYVCQEALGIGIGIDELRGASPSDHLDVFNAAAAHEELVVTLELACRVAKVARVLTWRTGRRRRWRPSPHSSTPPTWGESESPVAAQRGQVRAGPSATARWGWRRSQVTG
jgi:hypothetical protein